MKHGFLKFLLGAVLLALQYPAHAARQCERGFQPHGDVCVSQRMSDYVVCLQAAGANQKKVTEILTQKALEGKGGAGTLGARVPTARAEASLKLEKNAENEIASFVEREFFPGGMAGCRLDDKGSYLEQNRRDDLRIVQAYVEEKGTVFESSRCGQQTVKLSHIRLTDSNIEVAYKEDFEVTAGSAKCPLETSQYAFVAWKQRETSRRCAADLKWLDEGFEISTEPRSVTVKLACLSGQCITCGETIKEKTRTGRILSERASTNNTIAFAFTVSSPPGDPSFAPFGRALARLVGAGSDAAFCKRNQQLCKG